MQLGPGEAHKAHNLGASLREGGESHLAGGRGEPLREQTRPWWPPDPRWVFPLHPSLNLLNTELFLG